MGYLSDTAEAAAYDLLGAIQNLAAKGGPGPFRQAAHLIGLRLTRRTVLYEEYFTYSLWRQDRGRAFLKDFLPNTRLQAFNDSLTMPARGLAIQAMHDKLATEAMLRARGLPMTETLALYHAGPAPDLAFLPGLQLLSGAEALAGYLCNPANLPVFGKPRADRGARGAAVIEAAEGADAVRFLGGRIVPVRPLAAEIVQGWPTGYMFQPFYQSDEVLRPHVGPAMASLRIVTLWTDRGIEPWYAVIRLPAKAAMHDGDALGQRIWGLVDLEQGRVVKLRDLRDAQTPDLTHGHDEAIPFLGLRLPHWDRAVEICRLAHESFPGHGIIGWDVFLTEAGALLNEANANPGHVYQVAAQRPLLNPDMRPAYARALAFAARHGGGAGGF